MATPNDARARDIAQRLRKDARECQSIVVLTLEEARFVADLLDRTAEDAKDVERLNWLDATGSTQFDVPYTGGWTS